jgi:ABC-type dipeptide/oligopeptide/nickel transport system permease subunit
MSPRVHIDDMFRTITRTILGENHLLWLILWCLGMGVFAAWAAVFLNSPALHELLRAFVNSLAGALLVVLCALVFGWATGVGLYFLDRFEKRRIYLVLNFLLNLIRSIPQIVGILLGYIVVSHLMLGGAFQSTLQQIAVTAVVISLFVFLEVADLIRERIAYYRGLEFYDAMLCCGISEWRIVNGEILLKNSIAHLVQKAVAVFGMAIFLQCSIDFIISVGLSTEVSSTNFPVTLGSVLARMDSKQYILAISTLFTDVTYIKQLLVRHLQGIGTAWTIVFTLLCTYKIANGLLRRYRL